MYRAAVFAFAMYLINSQTLADERTTKDAEQLSELICTLCVCGGSHTMVSANIVADLTSKLSDVLSGKIGAEAAAGGNFTHERWTEIIGGFSKDMTPLQVTEADKIRQCMESKGYELILLNLK